MEKLQVYNPFGQVEIDVLNLASEKEVEAALNQAYQIYNDQSKWLKIYERILVLEKFVRLLEEHKEELIQLSVQEGGKPIKDTEAEMARAINGVKLAVGYIANMKGVEVPMGITPPSENKVAFTTKEPIGVVVSISAFNHPINLAIHQIIPAIATGCPVIYKPALTTPLVSKKMVELLYEAGLPKAYCTYLVCSNELSEKLATDKRVAYVSFIGSAKVGWYLRSKLAPGTHIALEHGGAAPLILCNDADLDKAIPGILKGGFYHAGQVCVSVQRVFVHSSVLPEVLTRLKKGAEELVVGDPLKNTTEVGPIITTEAQNRIESWVKEALDEGAALICGGETLPSNCYQPTILLNPNKDSKVSREEIFGPVVCLYGYDDLNTAIERANDSEFEFQSAVFSKDIDKAIGVAKAFRTQAAMINNHTAFRVDWMPFGGAASSGIGVGGIQYSMDEMTRDKLIVINSN